MNWLLPLGILVGILALLSLLVMPRKGGSAWPEFYMEARKAGFSLAEARLLREAAIRAGLEELPTVFSTTRGLDAAIAALNTGSVSLGREDRTRRTSRLLEKVYELRKRLEFERPRHAAGIRSSRAIAQGQRVKLLVQGLGVYSCTVLDSNARYLVLSYPVGGRIPPGFVWQGKRVSIYFWRRDDAGYVFDSFVIDDLRIRDIPVIHVGHSESLLRTQKRKSVRARTSLPAYLYLLKRIEGAYEKAESEAGMRARLLDVSEDGFAVMVGGKGRTEMLVKTQFSLGSRQVVMSGTVRSVTYDPEKNRSILHVEAVQPSPRMLNLIRSYVYGNSAGREAGAEAPQRASDV